MENGPAKKVRFLVTDLVHPHPAQVLLELYGGEYLEGEVAAGTSDGEEPYLVVRVPGLGGPVIVPLDRTQRLARPAPVPSRRA